MIQQERPRITPRQAEALGYVVGHWREHGCSPTVLELSRMMGIATSGAHRYIGALRDAELLHQGKTYHWRNARPTLAGLDFAGVFAEQ